MSKNAVMEKTIERREIELVRGFMAEGVYPTGIRPCIFP
jgi:hypothetical protein